MTDDGASAMSADAAVDRARAVLYEMGWPWTDPLSTSSDTSAPLAESADALAASGQRPAG